MIRVGPRYFAAIIIIIAIGCTTIASAEGAMPVGGMASTDQRLTIKSANEPQKGELLYSDDFSDPGSGWKRSSTSEAAFAYKNGRYHITVLIPQTSLYAYIPNAQTFKDFIVEVEAKAEVVTEDGSYGLALRRADNGEFYRFELKDDGKFAFYIYKNEEWITLVSFTASSAIKTGTGTNKIKIIAQGDTFTFYVNGEQLGECSDRTLSSGEIGLFASTRDSGDVEVSFDNLNVWEIGTAGAAEVVSGAHITVRPGESIQDAIDRASEGSTIEVQSGTYRENVDVTKPLTLRGVGNPVVEASDNHSAILLSADGIVLDGFTVTNAGVSGSIIGGIEAHSSGNIIRNNIAKRNDQGILLWHSSNNIITGNRATNNAEKGIYLLTECNGNNISDNTVSSNDEYGIHIYNSTNNKVVGNTISDNDDYGISISDSRNNALYRNKLVDNRNDAFDDLEDTQLGTNKWDDGSIGNYYSHLQCADRNSDGICDSPYSIPGGISVDRYPMASISEIGPGRVVPAGGVNGGERISNSATINSLQSGSASTSEGVRVDVPAGAVPPNEDGSPGKMVFSIEKDTTQIPSLPSDLKSFGSVYQLGPEGFIFNQPVEITLPIPEGVDPNQVMGITTFNDSSNQWELIPGTVDPQSRTVTIKTDHFSVYGIFGSSSSSDPDAWKRANGGWIKIMNSHSRQSSPYYSECDPADTGRREHCKGLPTSISHGICILAIALDDPSLGYMIPRNLPWSIIASDWHERSIAPDVQMVWVPSGTYNIQEELGISEVNNDPLYLPCCQVKANPAKAVRVAPGATVDFGDYSAFNEGPATVCGSCPMCPSAGRRARGASAHETSVLTGDVQVTLTWHAEADIDLYVEDPNGDEVSYSNPSVSSGGELDRDNKCDNFEMGKPENIYWPEGGAPEGTYKVRVNYYEDCNDAGPVRWTVRVVVGSVAKTYTGTLEAVGDTQDVTTFEKGAG